MDVIPFNLVEAVPLASSRQELDQRFLADRLIESVLRKPLPDSSSSARPPTTKQYKCDICEKSFSSFQALGGHKTVHRNTNNKKTWDEPRKIFTAKSRKRSRCLELFPTSSEIDTASELPFECSICCKRFSTSQALGGHKSSHRKTHQLPSIVPSYLQLFPESCSLNKSGEIDLELRLGS